MTWSGDYTIEAYLRTDFINDIKKSRYVRTLKKPMVIKR